MNKTNEVKFWLTIYSCFDVSMIMVIIIKKNKYLKSLSRKKNVPFIETMSLNSGRGRWTTKEL